TGFLTSDAEMRRASYYDMMSNIACQYGIPVGLFDAMIIRESRYRPDAFSRKNAFGLTQLMPDTAVALGVNRYSINENLRGGA
ncbi:lytic transglycosylase domain-containing protein, partial [Acinetobacter baumannii]